MSRVTWKWSDGVFAHAGRDDRHWGDENLLGSFWYTSLNGYTLKCFVRPVMCFDI